MQECRISWISICKNDICKRAGFQVIDFQGCRIHESTLQYIIWYEELINHLAFLSFVVFSHQGLDISTLKLPWTVCYVAISEERKPVMEYLRASRARKCSLIASNTGFPFPKVDRTQSMEVSERRFPNLDGLSPNFISLFYCLEVSARSLISYFRTTPVLGFIFPGFTCPGFPVLGFSVLKFPALRWPVLRIFAQGFSVQIFSAPGFSTPEFYVPGFTVTDFLPKGSLPQDFTS